MAALSRAFDWLLEALAWVAAAMIALALTAVSFDVVMRYFFNAPIAWVMQASEYVMLYVPMLAAAYVLRREEHVSVDIVVGALSPKAQRRLTAVTSVLGAVVAAIVAYGGWLVTSEQFRLGTPTLDAVKVPAFLVTAAIPLGCALLAAQCLRRALAALRDA